jgi:hypothetical protein
VAGSVAFVFVALVACLLGWLSTQTINQQSKHCKMAGDHSPGMAVTRAMSAIPSAAISEMCGADEPDALDEREAQLPANAAVVLAHPWSWSPGGRELRVRNCNCLHNSKLSWKKCLQSLGLYCALPRETSGSAR